MNLFGYAPVRRGLSEHVADGRMSHIEHSCYVHMICQANPETGIWIGSAKKLAADFCLTERSGRRVLEALQSKHYLRKFARRGRHGNYPILIDKFQPTKGRGCGKQVNAWETNDITQILYEKIPQIGEERGEQGGEEMGEDVAFKIFRELRIENKQPAAASEPKGKGSVWNFLKIDPCGPNNFRQLVETQWTRRNGGHYSKLLGEAVDAWEAANGMKPPRTAEFFQALKKLRDQERVAIPPQSRIPTVSDIRPRER